VTNRLGFFVFLAVGSLLLAAGHYYLWRRLVRDPRLPGLGRWCATLALVLLALGLPLTWTLARTSLRDLVLPVTGAAFVWMGLLFYLVVLLGARDAARGLARLARRVRPGKPQLEVPRDGERRVFLARAGAAGVLVASSAVTGYGMARAAGEFECPEVPVKLERLPRALSGYRIVQLSDLHLGPVLHRDFCEHVVARANSLKPDLVVITGDLVDGTVGELAQEVAALAGLRARHGVYFATGNHEFYSDAGPWLEFLPSLGIRVLDNARAQVGDGGPGGASFDLAGVHDPNGAWFGDRYRPDLARALAGRDPERELLLLAHRPSQVEVAARHGVGLQLSGHTHGGQLWPWSYLVYLQQPYLRGLHRHTPGTQVYVTCGTGTWGPPLRVGAPPEITQLILTA
jgi:predicted MPP superfamily phosphohydrolase